MRFGVFYERQLPRPWQPDSEHHLFKDALDHLAPTVDAALARRGPAREAPDTGLVPVPGF